MLNMKWIPINTLKPNPRNARRHPKKQIRQIGASITTFGFVVPIVISEDGTIIAGHGRYAAALVLGLKTVPTIEVRGLSEAKLRALALADNKIAENAGWDRERLALELPELTDLLVREGLDISITGFAPVEIDQIVTDFEQDTRDPDDIVDPDWIDAAPVSRPGDLWQLGSHRLLCADARKPNALAHLMDQGNATMAFLDAALQCSRQGHRRTRPDQARRVRDGLWRVFAVRLRCVLARNTVCGRCNLF